MVKKINTSVRAEDLNTMDAFLNLIEKDMASNPKSIQPLVKNDMDEIEKLVEDIDVD